MRVGVSTKRPLVQAKNILIRVRQYGFCRALRNYSASCTVAFGNFHGHQTFQSEMNDDHVYADAQ
jgi:hypothetical protein